MSADPHSGHDGGTCADNIDDQPPAAGPVVSGTGPGQAAGWFTKATITWHWYDLDGTVDPARCPATTTTAAQGNPVTATGCRTTDAISGVAKQAKLSVAAGGRWGLGAFTAPCAGATNKAGLAQAVPVSVKFTAAAGLSAVLAPKNKATVAHSAKTFVVAFRLDHLSATAAATLASQRAIRVTLASRQSPR